MNGCEEVLSMLTPTPGHHSDDGLPSFEPAYDVTALPRKAPRFDLAVLARRGQKPLSELAKNRSALQSVSARRPPCDSARAFDCGLAVRQRPRDRTGRSPGVRADRREKNKKEGRTTHILKKKKKKSSWAGSDQACRSAGVESGLPPSGCLPLRGPPFTIPSCVGTSLLS